MVTGVGKAQPKNPLKDRLSRKVDGVIRNGGHRIQRFPTQQVQALQTITIDRDGAKLFDNQLAFPWIRSYHVHMRPARTRKTRPHCRTFTVPVLSVVAWFANPPLSQTTVPVVSLAPPLLAPSPSYVDRTRPSAFDSHPLFQHNVEGAVTANDGFPPICDGVVLQDSSF